jgi:hypothetical protein
MGLNSAFKGLKAQLVEALRNTPKAAGSTFYSLNPHGRIKAWGRLDP